MAATGNITPIRVLICGATGYGNLGDDAIRNQLIRHLGANYPVEIKVTRPFPQVEMVEWAEAVFIGGGGILYDGDGVPHGQANFDYYVGDYLRWAVERGKPVALAAVGVQALTLEKNLALLRELLKKTDYVSVRQQRDYDILRAAGFEGRLILGDDVAFLTEGTDIHFLAPMKPRPPLLSWLPRRRRLCFMPQSRLFERVGFKNIVWMLRLLERRGYEVHLVSTAYEDEDALQRLVPYTKLGRQGLSYQGRLAIPEVIALLRDMDLLVSSRFHGIVFAKIANVPRIVGISRSNKITEQLPAEANIYEHVARRDAAAVLRCIENPAPLRSFGAPEAHLQAIDDFMKRNFAARLA